MMTSCLHGASLIVKLEVDSEKEVSKQLLCSRGKHTPDEEQKRFHPTEPKGNKQKRIFSIKCIATPFQYIIYATTLRHLHFDPGHLMGSASSVPITVPVNLVQLIKS